MAQNNQTHQIQTPSTQKVLTTTHPPYRHNLISIQPPHSTRCLCHATLAEPPTSSLLHITKRSFRYASPYVWNQLLSSLCQPQPSPSVSVLAVYAPATSSHSVNSPLSPSITPSFTPNSKPTSFTNLSHHRVFRPQVNSTDFMTGPCLLGISVVFDFSFFVTLRFFGSIQQIWLCVNFWMHI